MRRSIPIFALLALLASASLAPPVTSQGNQGSGSDRARFQLEQTDDLLARAKDAVQAANVPAAHLALEAAIDLQAQAWRAFRNQYLVLAQSLTRKARDYANKAIAAGRISEQNESAALRRLEKAEDYMERAREYLAAGQGTEFEAFYRSSRDNLDRAWEFYRQGQYRPTVLLVDQVEKTLQKMVDLAGRQERLRNQYERHLEAVEEFGARARETVAQCRSAVARQLMDEAVRAWELAREMGSKGRYDAAIKTLQNARKLATDAVSQCQNGRSLQSRYERLRQEADLLAEDLGPSDNRGRQLLETAYEQLDLARDQLEQGAGEAAVAALRAADMTLDQLRQHLRMSGF